MIAAFNFDRMFARDQRKVFLGPIEGPVKAVAQVDDFVGEKQDMTFKRDCISFALLLITIFFTA